jgi:ABC-type glycerol-3-phosphate transport system permease component
MPFAVLVLWAFLTQLPPGVLEAAEVDGATPLRQMLHVALPLARPALVVVGVWAFVTSWNEYLLPTLVSQDGSLQTVPTLLASFIGHYDTQYGPLAAGSLMAAFPALALYLVGRRPAGTGLARAVRGRKA